MSCSTSTTAVPSAAIDRKTCIDVANDHRRETKRELVAQQKPRIRHQAATDRDHLLLAA